MKKVMAMAATIITGCAMFLMAPQSAFAASDVAVFAGVAEEAVRNGYEGSVISRMVGRAGATAPNGAKGIAFEVLYQDMKNATSGIVNNVKTQFTKSSTAKTVDLVSMSDEGKVVARYQLKDTPDSIRNTMKQVAEGKYNSAKLVGTSETAEAFNAKAAANGISKVMEDSGIPTGTTSRIANKALATVNAGDLAKVAGKAGAVGAAISSGVALAESVITHDDFGETVANVTVKGSTGAASAAAAGVAGELAAAGLATAGVTGATAIAVPAATTIGVGLIVGTAANTANEKFGLDEKIASVANDAKDIAEVKAAEFVDAASDAGNTMLVKGTELGTYIAAKAVETTGYATAKLIK